MQNNQKAALFGAFLVSALGLGALASYVQNTPEARRVPPEIRRESSNRPATPTLNQEPMAMSTVRFAEVKNGKVVLSGRTPIPKSTGPALFATNRSLESMGAANAKVLSIEIENGIALLNANSAMLEGFGSLQESEVIEALSLTLGQFPNVKGFTISVEGTQLDTLGHFELENPVPVTRIEPQPET
jgi:hypothetical protein